MVKSKLKVKQNKNIDEKTFAKIRKNLEKEKKQLEQELKKIKFPDYGTSDEAKAQEVEEFEESLSLQKEFRNLLREIEAALKKVDSGTYGVCESCQGIIETERLKAYFAATLCLGCAQKTKR